MNTARFSSEKEEAPQVSIKLKITLSCAALVTLVCVCVLAFIIAAGDRVTAVAAQTALVAAVEDAAAEIDWDDGEIEIDEDIAFYVDGVYLSVYTADGVFYAGSPINDAIRALPLDGSPYEDAPVTVRAESLREGRFLLADVEVTFKKHDSVWVRGAVSLSGADSAISSVTRVALFALPAVIALSALLGYWLTRRALLPISRMTDTARHISESGNLNERIGLKGGNPNDEMQKLAATFDVMLDRVEHAFASEKQFTSDASHELRTPITVITSQAEYALDLIETDAPDAMGEAEKSLHVILRKSQQMTSLISQLLTLARADRGTEKLTMERLDLGALAAEITEEFADSPRVLDRSITVVCETVQGLFVRGDRGLLRRMTENLLSNAVKFNRTGGHITVTVSATADRVVLRVADTGCGISDADLPHIFDRFYQADKARAGGDGSMGLGLSMVRWIAETAHGGQIDVRSIPGAGSEFTVTLKRELP